MPSIVKAASSRSYLITPNDNGLILDFGPGASSSTVGTFVFQFNPDATSDYTVLLMGRAFGAAAVAAGVPFVPIPYHRVTINNVAQDYAMSAAVISGPSLIQVPANWDVGLYVSTTVGSCQVVSWDLQGSSAP